SRRRHTRLVSDWSSDVCSSDLFAVDVLLLEEAGSEAVDAVVDSAPEQRERRLLDERDVVLGDELAALEPVVVEADVGGVAVLDEIGRASCRGRVEIWVVGVRCG